MSCEPEDDFETWMLLVCSSSEDISQFLSFLSSFVRLLEDISEGGSLRGPIADKTDEFLSKLDREIVPSILSWNVLPDGNTIQTLFSTLIKVGIYGIRSQRIPIIQVFAPFIDYYTSHIYCVDQSAFSPEGVRAVAASMGMFDACLESLKDGVKDVGVLDLVCRLSLALIKEVEESKFWELAQTAGSATLGLVQAEKRTPTASITMVFESMFDEARRHASLPDDFCVPWMQLCVVLIKSDIMEKQLAGLRTMSDLMLDEQSSNSTKLWFEADPARANMFKEFKNIHPELCLSISEIVAKLAEFGLLEFDILSDLWKLHAVQHASDIQKFYVIFSSVATSLDKNWIMRFVDMCMNPVEKTEQWYKFIGSLGSCLASRDDCCEAFRKVRDFLYGEAIQKNPWAQAELPEIIGKNLTDEEFTKYSRELMGNLTDEFNVASLASIVGNHQCPNDEMIQEILSRALKALETASEPDKLLKLIDNLCMYNRQSLSSEQTICLYERGKGCQLFTNNMACIFSMRLINFDTLMELMLKEEVVNYNITKIVRIAVFGANGFCPPVTVTKLPFIGEDFLWNMVLRETQQQQNLTTLLVTLYSRNDGIELTDYYMMTYFIQKWNSIFAKTDKKTTMLGVLRAFISDIEKMVDMDSFNVKRHLENKNVPVKKVTVIGKCLASELTFVLPEDTYCTVLRQKISKLSLLPACSFVISKAGQAVSDSQQLKQLCPNQNEVKFLVRALTAREAKLKLAHQRNMIPSVLLGQSGGETFELLLSLLKDDMYSESVKMVLDYLPTSPLTMLQIEEITRKSNYDLSKFLPVEFPKLFQYNFEALSSLFNDTLTSRFMQNGGFLSLVKSIPKCPSMTLQIVQFLEKTMTIEMKNSIRRDIYETILPVLGAYAVKERESGFKALINLINQLDVDVEMDPGVITDAMKSLFSSELLFVRSFSQSLFTKLPIPMDSFVDMMDMIDEGISAEFYGAFLAHIDKPCDKLVLQIANACKTESIALPSLLKILETMLKNGWVSGSDQTTFTNYFIERFLMVDGKDKDSELFDLAVLCLAHLQNDILYGHLDMLHTNKDGYSSWGMVGDTRPASSTGHSGIDNMGATCFLNSTLQQFFAIAPLRNKIISYRDTDEFMSALSEFFARMYLGKGQPLSAESLVSKWTDWGGEPMNPMVQQDAYEFAQMLVDKIEGGLSREVIQDLFGGNTVDVIEGMSTEYKAERNIPFTSITLPIAGSSTMNEALEKFELPDFLTGDNQYQADGIGKIDAKKYSKLGKLPKYFIVQLGRFEYNYTTWVRTKINQPFSFPVDWDLTKCVAQPDGSEKFHLTGVVVHTGTADFGHYTSYVKYGDRWLHFNDSAVTEESLSDIKPIWYGDSRSCTSAYILFYTRDDVLGVTVPEPEIPNSLEQTIREEIAKMNDVRLYCSQPYFELMKHLAGSSVRFREIAMRYYFDTLPYTTFVKRALEIADPICNQLGTSEPLKRSLLGLILNSGIECALANCPEVSVRTGAYNMIKCVDLNAIPVSVIQALFGNPSHLIRFFRIWDEKYRLLEIIVGANAKASELAIEQKWALKIAALLLKTAPEYYNSANEEGIKERSFWKQLDLSGIFLLLSHLPIPEILRTYLLGGSFLSHMLQGRTQLSTYVTLVNSLPAEVNARDVVLARIMNSVDDSYIRIGELLFRMFRENAFAKVSGLQVKIQGKLASNWDFACLLCYLSAFDDMKQLLLDHTDKWLMPLLCDRTYQCRVVTMYTLVRLVPHKVFDAVLDDWPKTSLMTPVYILLADDSEEMNQNAQRLLSVLISSMPNVVSAVKQAFNERESRDYGARYIAYHFIVMMRKFALITKRDISSELLSLCTTLLPYRMEYDEHIMAILQGLNELHTQADPELALELFTYLACYSTQYGIMMRFLKDLSPHMGDSVIPRDDDICGFLGYCAFAPSNTVISHYDLVSPLVVRFAKARQELVLTWLLNQLDDLAHIHLSGVVIILEAINKKLPIMGYLWAAASAKQYLPLDSLVSRTCRYSSECEFDPLPLVSLLNSADLGSEGRNCLWRIMVEKKPDYEQFAKQFTWKGDQEQLIDYLLAVKSPLSKTLLLESTQTNVAAFAKAYSFLKEIAAQEIMEITFITAVLSLDFQSYTDAIVRYIEDAFVAHPDDKDRIIRRIGHLDPRDISGIEEAMRNHFGFDIPDCIEAP